MGLPPRLTETVSWLWWAGEWGVEYMHIKKFPGDADVGKVLENSDLLSQRRAGGNLIQISKVVV